MRRLSDYFRLPSRDAVRVVREDAAAPHTSPTLSCAGDELLELCDSVSASVLAAQKAIGPGGAFHLAFARGSVVQNRLQVSRIWWAAVDEIFGLGALATDLEPRYGRAAVAGTLQEIQRRGTEALLRHRGGLGPAKLMIRLRAPDEELWACTDYRQIEVLMNRMSEMGRDCDELTRSVLAEPGSRDSLQSARADLTRWLNRCDLVSHTASVLHHFDALLAIQQDARCLHPCLPFEPAALQQIAAQLDVSTTVARQFVCLLRFAWVTSLVSSADLSDLSFKALCVFPRAARDARPAPDGTLTGRLANALQDAVASDPVMQAFRRRFPDAPIETTQLSLCLPEPVYTLFAADRSLDARLRILVMSHLGGTYFEEFVSARAGRIARASLPRAGWIDNVTSLRVRATSADVGHIDRETLVARGLSPAHVSQMLAKAIEDDSGRYLDKCHKLFRRVARRDLVGNLRGVWSLTTGSGTGS